MPLVVALVLGPVMMVTGCGATARSDEQRSVTVFAAASLKSSFEQIAAEFAHTEDIQVTFSVLGSQDLVANLSGGAPADVLATADERSMARAAEHHLVGEVTVFAQNTLVLVTAPGNPVGITGLDASLDGRKLVICDQAVPCGAATATLASNLDITLNPVSREQKVSDVMAKITTGEADAGVVYATDAATAAGKVATVQIQRADQVVNKYPIALSAEPANPAEAQKFLDFVLSPAGQRVLVDHGFVRP